MKTRTASAASTGRAMTFAPSGNLPIDFENPFGALRNKILCPALTIIFWTMLFSDMRLLLRPACCKGLLVDREDLLGDGVHNGVEDGLFFQREKLERGAQEHEVEGPLVAGGNGKPGAVEGHDGLYAFFYDVVHVCRILFRGDGDADRADLARVVDDRAVVLQKMEVAGGFQRLEPDQEVGFALGDDRREDLFPEAHLREHAPAALGHAVHLALLHVEAGKERRLGDDLAGEEHSLPAHAGYQNIEYV